MDQLAAVRGCGGSRGGGAVEQQHQAHAQWGRRHCWLLRRARPSSRHRSTRLLPLYTGSRTTCPAPTRRGNVVAGEGNHRFGGQGAYQLDLPRSGSNRGMNT